MNNPKLLTGLLTAILSGFGVCAFASGPRVVTLEEIFEVAESSSATLRPFMTAVDEADKAIDVARNGRLPEISAGLSVGYIGNGFTTARDLSDYQSAPIPHLSTGVGLSVEQPLYTGGALTNSIRLAEAKSTAARYTADFHRDNLRLRLTGFYLDLFKYSNLRNVVVENRSLANRVLDQMKARYEHGTALQNDITRYELLVENLDLQLVKLDNTLDILNRNLVVTAGLPEGTLIVPDSTMLTRSLPRDPEREWQQAASDFSPSLALARCGVEMSKRGEALTRAEYLPKIGLKASWTMDGPILVEIPPINRNLSYWFVGIGINYNLSSLFKTGKKMAQSKDATLEATQRLEATTQEIELAIRADYVRYLEAYQELTTQQKSVELATRNYNVVSMRYNEEMALITDMLDAANSLLDANERLVNAGIDIIYYYYKLLFTSGQI